MADSAAAEAILRQERLFDRMLVRCLSTHSERAVHLKVLTLALFRSNYLYQLKILLLVNPYLVTLTLFDVHPKATEGLRVRDPPPIDTVPSANSNLPTISNNSNNPNTSNNSDGPNSSENPSSSKPRTIQATRTTRTTRSIRTTRSTRASRATRATRTTRISRTTRTTRTTRSFRTRF